MQITTNIIDTANANLSALIKPELVETKTQEIAIQAAKKAKVSGFRPGKVPAKLMMQQHKKELEQDAKNQILGEILNLGLKELKKDTKELIGEPLVTKFDENENGIDVQITISFRPNVDVSGYEALLPKFDAPVVEKKEVEERINEILKNFGKLEKSDKTKLENGDFAKFDFEGFINGEAFEGGKAQNYILEIGSGQFIPGFEESMIGLNIAEEKEIQVKFPDDYGAKHLAGKMATFKVFLHEIQKRVEAKLNDEILKKLLPNEKEPTKELLEDSIKDQMRTSKFITLLNGQIKEQFAQALVEKYNFDIPQNILDQEINMRLRNDWHKFSADEQKQLQESKEALEAKIQSYKDDAARSVKLTFIIDELAKVNKISVSDQELLQAIYMEAYRSGIEPKKHFEQYKNAGMLPAIKMAIVEEKLFLHLFKLPDDEKKSEKKTNTQTEEKVKKTKNKKDSE